MTSLLSSAAALKAVVVRTRAASTCVINAHIDKEKVKGFKFKVHTYLM